MDRKPGPESLGEDVQRLIEGKTPETPAFADVNHHMNTPLCHTQERRLGDSGHKKSMDGGMGAEPPAPAEGLPATRTFLPGHPIALESEISYEVGHRQHQKDVQDRW
jgi:hypothetical protein